MDAILDTHFQRVEAALNTLINSITSYNPSEKAADDLVAADDQLLQGLEQLATHQANHQRILHLRQTADALTAQAKSKLRSLADARKELINTPVSTFPASSKNVPLDELLSYAKRIAKFTLPPNYRPAPPPRKPSAPDATPKATNETQTQLANGTSGTPALADSAAAAPPKPDPQADLPKDEGVALSTLTQEQRDWLDSMFHTPFVPWPSEAVIQRGGLMEIQRMLERGRDPGAVLPPKEQEAEERRRAEEEERRKREEEEEEGRRREVWATQMARRGEGQGEVFGGLDLYDPEEDE
ncbi:hypothetical protein H2201_002118 [Coniosporium apollinis]|uniref:Mediator of RNA polymerase II transcription subunit 4 n=1 Tax=Coniosporium apollinis TaxID=61459 RepID=A0ABQ9P0L4_9PEZI|nr:hypothetical protein H2201_002118 [Coniosporium apollinis]